MENSEFILLKTQLKRCILTTTQRGHSNSALGFICAGTHAQRATCGDWNRNRYVRYKPNNAKLEAAKTFKQKTWVDSRSHGKCCTRKLLSSGGGASREEEIHHSSGTSALPLHPTTTWRKQRTGEFSVLFPLSIHH